MLKPFLFLISIYCASANAIDWEGKPDNLQLNGFVYFTTFSDSDWYDDRKVVGLNVDYDIGNFALRSQINSYSKEPVRRAVFEVAMPLMKNTEMIIQAGRFTRPDSFYSGITDHPAVYQMAMPPNAGYSYRMFHGAFALMDGMNYQTSWRNDKVLVRARWARGKMVISDQPELIMEAFKRPLEGRDEVYLEPNKNSEDYGLHLETEHWHTYVSRNIYRATTEQVGSSTLARTVATLFYKIDYRIDKVGIRYDTNNKWWIQGEAMHNYVLVKDKRKPTTQNTVGNSIDYNIVSGYRVNDNWTAYVGHSYGYNRTTVAHNVDQFIGVTWNNHPFTISAEYHRGEGAAWRKYDAPTVTSGYPQIDSFVVSGTYVF